ncbi:MAG TPA: hypothetical protein ENJ88_00245 [Phaeodactylibacter sp.]|nr:hypothetical protein [Phaeodactylibacter sp.]
MKPIQTLALLILLTLSTSLLAVFFPNTAYIALPVMLLSSLKFLLVAFQFMELRQAHVFWKILLVSYLILFLLIFWVSCQCAGR